MAYVPRIDKTGIYNSPYWYSAANAFYPQAQLPNCTCYAYGRWLELGYTVSSLGLGDGNAQNWYPNTLNKGVLTCSQQPALGAIACWTRGDGGRGHVGVVETIDTNGDLLVSMSGYQRPITSPVTDMRKFFWLERELLSLNYRTPNWMIVYDEYGNVNQSQTYYLQGFIHPPNAETLDWIYQITDQYPTITNYKENNARLIYGELQAQGWRLESIAAVLGNMESEGILNPGQCEIGRGLPAYNTSTGVATSIYYPPPSGAGYGLGLCGWTGYRDTNNNINYPNAVLYYSYTNNVAWYDGSIQCKVLDLADDPTFCKLGTNAQCYGWIPTTTYPGSYADFRINAGNKSVADLAKEFLYNFEKPADPSASEATRVAQAEYWYNYLLTAGPVNPPFEPGNPTDPIKKMPVWAMIRYH